jgi:inner membrane transporter RhtA
MTVRSADPRTDPPARSPLAAAPPPVLVLAGIVSVQMGAGLAGRLFGEVGPAGVTALRLWWAALIMAALGGRALGRSLRAALADHAWRDLSVAVVFGVVLGVMNYSIYQAFARIPLGVAVTIEFLGPLAIAVGSSRKRLDLVWVALAAAGVLLLTQGGTSAVPVTGSGPPPGGLAGLGPQATGIAFALVAAACWAAYIRLSRSTGQRFAGSTGLVIAMIVAALVVLGPSVAQARGPLLHPAVLAEGLIIGLLSSVIPYRLELEALRRVPTGVFGIWMSLEPVVAALVGLVLLSETLAAREWLAMVLVIIACAGAARFGASQQPGPPAEPDSYKA